MNESLLLRVIKGCILLGLLILCILYLPILFEEQLGSSISLIETVILSLLATGVMGSFLKLDAGITVDLTKLENLLEKLLGSLEKILSKLLKTIANFLPSKNK